MNEIDPLTDQDKINLLHWWEAFQARNNPLLDDPWTPSFGSYPADLLFPDDFVTDEEDPAGAPRPDPHYYQAAGQEPPQEAQGTIEPGYPIIGAMCAFILLGGAVVTIWASLAYLFPWVVSCYLNMVCK